LHIGKTYIGELDWYEWFTTNNKERTV
jgi:hypothetical protein